MAPDASMVSIRSKRMSSVSAKPGTESRRSRPSSHLDGESRRALAIAIDLLLRIAVSLCRIEKTVGNGISFILAQRHIVIKGRVEHRATLTPQVCKARCLRPIRPQS